MPEICRFYGGNGHRMGLHGTRMSCAAIGNLPENSKNPKKFSL